MSNPALPTFQQAIEAGQNYVRASVRARDAQYGFIACAYLAYREGERFPRAYQEAIHTRLHRDPTVPERKRPFLLLLHALIGQEHDCPQNTLPAFSKLTAALEKIDEAFSGVAPQRQEVIDFIKDSGGVVGLYDLSRLGASSEGSAGTATGGITDLKPTDIALPHFGLCITKVGRGYRIRLIERPPGKYFVCLRVGRGGFLEAIVEQDGSHEEVA